MRLESGVAVIEKTVGETPLAALERFRREHSIGTNVPLAYAGRLDPMASGALLILIGETCKRQTEFHGLDKEYVVEVLFGVASDTGDVLGIVRASKDREPTTREVTQILSSIVGTVTFPYPHFSAKTVRGKPLHMWTLEGRLDEITIPMNTSKIYSLRLEGMRTVLATELLQSIHAKIDTIPEVTDARKTLGKNFRRDEVHASWDHIAQESARAVYTVATIRCIVSSGTYMRTLAEEIAKRLSTAALALSIHRTRIGRYRRFFGPWGLWTRRYCVSKPGILR